MGALPAPLEVLGSSEPCGHLGTHVTRLVHTEACGGGSLSGDQIGKVCSCSLLAGMWGNGQWWELPHPPGERCDRIGCMYATFDAASPPLDIHPHGHGRYVARTFTAWCTATPWQTTETLTKEAELRVQEVKFQ